MNVKDEKKSIVEILKEIFKDSKGESLVDEKEKKFRINEENEEILFEEFVLNVSERGRYVATPGMQLKKCCDRIIKLTENNEKGFIFGNLADREKKDSFPEYIFSVEIVDLGKSKNVELPSLEIINDKLSKVKDSIVRIKTEQVFLVAIKIGSKNTRDYAALKNYIISSDNRTYNKVIRNMIEYVEVEKKNVNLRNATALPHNLLVSGAPGTGKSYFLQEKIEESGEKIIKDMMNKYSSGHSEEEKKATAIKAYCDNYVTRVTFYEDYSYENFIGCYKPIPTENTAVIQYNGGNGSITENKITYQYVSGPFIDTYIKAKINPENNYFLIIEEINRAKAASVFGEMFQLLDRKNGVSEYEIKPDASLDGYLQEKMGEKYDGFMKLPCNMYIWATMNSADQGVLPLDSAFKRRWSSLYMDINGSQGACPYKMDLWKESNVSQEILWENLRNEINKIILLNGFDEDRCIGSWYFSEAETAQISKYSKLSVEERKSAVNPLVDKLFFYLRQDVFRRNPSEMFRGENGEKNIGITMSDIRRRVRQGEAIETILRLRDKEPLKWIEPQSSASDSSSKE